MAYLRQACLRRPAGPTWTMPSPIPHRPGPPTPSACPATGLPWSRALTRRYSAWMSGAGAKSLHWWPRAVRCLPGPGSGGSAGASRCGWPGVPCARCARKTGRCPPAHLPVHAFMGRRSGKCPRRCAFATRKPCSAGWAWRTTATAVSGSRRRCSWQRAPCCFHGTWRGCFWW